MSTVTTVADLMVEVDRLRDELARQIAGREIEQTALRNALPILAARNDLLPHVDPQTLHHLQADWFAAQILAAHYRRLGNGQASEPPNTDWPIITNGDPA